MFRIHVILIILQAVGLAVNLPGLHTMYFTVVQIKISFVAKLKPFLLMTSYVLPKVKCFAEFLGTHFMRFDLLALIGLFKWALSGKVLSHLEHS